MRTMVEYILPDPALEAYTWVHENEHGPASQPPLLRGGTNGMMPPSRDGVPTRLTVNGYTYTRTGAGGPMDAPPGTLPDRLPLPLWEETWLPQVNALRDEILAFDPASVAPGQWADTFQDHGRAFGHVFRGVHMETVMPSGRAVEQFLSAYVALFGEEQRAQGLALLQGFPNHTLDRAQRLWDLSRLVRADADLQAAFARTPVRWETRGAGAAFEQGWQALMREYGETVDQFVQDLPTWSEDPTTALTLVRAYAQQPDGRGPREAEAARRAERETLAQALRERVATDAAAASLVETLAAAQGDLMVRENHNYLCDQRLSAASRARWLRIGAYLHERGAVQVPDDVFFYFQDELVTALEGNAPLTAAEVADRRAAQAAYRAAPPPPVLGKPFPPAESSTASGGGRPATLRGTAASAGVYQGRARVIRSLAEADRLEAGDVLVCGVTAQAWTPYFAVVGALVTDAGGALSHSAVVAREYGIPAVVGTRTATQRIPDGAQITVDGTAGVVLVEPAVS